MTTPSDVPRSNAHSLEVAQGERFAFGKNWASFLRALNENRIRQAEQSLQRMLGLSDLSGKSFLDIGSGSGLFSLAARRLGARPRSFDYDPDSVACTNLLKARYFPDDANWIIEAGSVLDDTYMRSLGQFDIVYSWGVLHHTGNMWRAIENAAACTAPLGLLYISIYNFQDPWSKRWLRIKRLYNTLPRPLRLPYGIAVMGVRELRYLVSAIRRFRLSTYVKAWTDYPEISMRGMSRWHDLIDWVGGLPFEVARPEEVFCFLKARGFLLENLVTCGGGLGCNEYVFRNGGERRGCTNDRPASPGVSHMVRDGDGSRSSS
jgi:2-polyprenyl-6-hydroxyphenyl methylase/3-demethylubiquinone-9 3-methyltransferase